jgi:rhamnosyltransferase
VLVLLATCNGAQWVRDQLESILAQKDVELQITARDDGSTDGTRVELARLATDPRIRVCGAAVPSGSAAQNFLTLIRDNAASGFDFVAFSDQDDIWHADKLSRACRMLSATSAAGYSCATLAAWEDGREVLLSQSTRFTAADFLFEGAGQGCTFVLPAAFYERVRTFALERQALTSAVHYHDWAVYALARAWRLQWCFDPIPSVKYRQHGSNDTGARSSFQGLKKRLTLIRSGWYRRQLEAIVDLCWAAAPDNVTVCAWRSLLYKEDGWQRRLGMITFCLGRGRRRMGDKLILVAAALAGWM